MSTNKVSGQTLSASVILVTFEPSYYVFIVFVLGGMMAGGIVGNASYLPAMLGFMLPAILPAVAILVTRSDILQINMGLMLAAFAVTLAIIGHNVNRSLLENLRMRIEQNILTIRLRASEAAMIEAQETAHVGSWELDPRTQAFDISKEARRILGVDPGSDETDYGSILAHVHPDDRPGVDKLFAEFEPIGSVDEIQARIETSSDAVKYVRLVVRSSYGADRRQVRLHGIIQDITERKSADDELQFANILLRTEMEASPDGILVVDTDRNVVLFNHQFSEMWRIPEAILLAGNDAKVLLAVTALVKDSEVFSRQVQYLYDHPDVRSHDEFETTDGRFIERHSVTLQTPSVRNLGRVWFFRDITKRKAAESRVLRMARYDGLTGLANRSVFVEELQRAIARATRSEKRLAVIYLDLDHFKDVNDTLGHPIGDELLKLVAERLRSNVRETDTVARFGGDEFAMIVPDLLQAADAALLADKLIHAMDASFQIHGNDIHIGISIGIDLYGPESLDAETLLSHADLALYRTKSEGRGSYRFFTDAMDAEVRTRVTLGAELRTAIDSNQLFLLYQPQVAAETGQITGLEALVRWRHPKHGILGPEVFIAISEQTGIVGKLGHWVLLTACRQAKTWLDAGLAPVRIAVNISALQFKTPLALEDDIAAVLAETGLPSHLLELELTEAVLMEASRGHDDILGRLRKAGVTVAIDDFGTGYSSLYYLHRFPAKRIKIAQALIRHLQTTSGDAAIVKATISLAHALGIVVVAEGVETAEQFELLKAWGCGEVQGFHLARPMSVDDVTSLLCDGTIAKQALQPVEGQKVDSQPLAVPP